MSTTECESALDTIVTKSWDRVRSTRELGAFIAHRLAVVTNVDDELDSELV